MTSDKADLPREILPEEAGCIYDASNLGALIP